MKPNRWLKLEDGEYVLLFGKHEGKTLHEVSLEEPEYLTWCYSEVAMTAEIEAIFEEYLLD